MHRALWPIERYRPVVQIQLVQAIDKVAVVRTLLADSGAGSLRAGFDLVLHEDDCVICGGKPGYVTKLAGAYRGTFMTYSIRILLPDLGFDHKVRAVGIPNPPPGFDGIACFPFLNRFSYGNFGDRSSFGLEG